MEVLIWPFIHNIIFWFVSVGMTFLLEISKYRWIMVICITTWGLINISIYSIVRIDIKYILIGEDYSVFMLYSYILFSTLYYILMCFYKIYGITIYNSITILVYGITYSTIAYLHLLCIVYKTKYKIKYTEDIGNIEHISHIKYIEKIRERINDDSCDVFIVS